MVTGQLSAPGKAMISEGRRKPEDALYSRLAAPRDMGVEQERDFGAHQGRNT